MSDTFSCPKCGRENPPSAEFCVSCHFVLQHRCPKCWHTQRGGDICEKCGTNFALFAELQLERSLAEQDRVARDKAVAGAGTYLQLLTLPFGGVGALYRALIGWIVSSRLSNR